MYHGRLVHAHHDLGVEKFIYEAIICGITERSRTKEAFIDNNQSALSEIRSFLDFCITKQNIEFMPDSSNRSSFEILLLESTRKSKQGTSYELKELLGQGLDEYYESGSLKFRRVT